MISVNPNYIYPKNWDMLMGSSRICFPTANLLQFNKFIHDGEWKDEIGKDDREVQVGGVYTFSGDNHINTGVKVQGQTPVTLNATILLNTSTYAGLFVQQWVTNSSKGINLLTTVTNELVIIIGDGTSQANIFTGITLSLNVKYDIELQWDGLTGVDNINLIVNGIATSISATKSWVGASSSTLFIGFWFTYFSTFSLYNYKYRVNNNNEVSSYCEQTEVYDTNKLFTTTTGILHTVGGTLTNFFGTDKLVYSDANARGYGILNSQPDLVVPLDSVTNEPVITCDTVYKGRVKYNIKIEDSNALILDGAGNYISTIVGITGGILIQKQTSIEFHILGKTSSNSKDDYRTIFYGGAYTSVLNGLYVRASITSGDIQVYYFDGTSQYIWDTGLSLENDTDLDIAYSWSGLVGDLMTLILNGVTVTHTALSEMSADATRNLNFFSYRNAGGQSFAGIVYSIHFNINNIERFILMSLADGIEIYDVLNDERYYVFGTAPTWTTATTKNNFNNTYGFSQESRFVDNEVGGAYAPLYSDYIVGGTNRAKGFNTINTISGLRDYKLYTETCPINGSAYIVITNFFTDLLFNQWGNVTFTIRNNDINPITVHKVGYSDTLGVIGISLASGETKTITSPVFNPNTNLLIYLKDNATWDIQIDNIYYEGAAYIPASLANPGYDVKGGTLTHPAILDSKGNVIGLNGSENTYEQYPIYELIQADVNNVWFEVDGTPKKLTYAELVANTGSYDFVDINDESNDKRNHLMYSTAQSEEAVFDIIECYMKGFVLPILAEWALIDGNYVYDTDKMSKFYIPNTII